MALEAVRVGSFDIDAAIQNYVRREHGIAIGERTAEEIKVAIGSADPTPDENQAEVRGRDLMTGLPKTVILTPEEVRYAIEDVVSSIVASVIRCLVQGAARAVAGLPRARHVPGRWRRTAPRARRSASSARPRSRSRCRTCRSKRSCSAPDM